MARKKPPEDHLNHEAWAIPYGDLITLLLAFFVVMYSISSVNEGKFRVLSDAMIQAFNGAPRSIMPVQVGKAQQRGTGSDQAVQLSGTRTATVPVHVPSDIHSVPLTDPVTRTSKMLSAQASAAQLSELAGQLEQALSGLIEDGLITVRRGPDAIAVEIATDILFRSGSATVGGDAADVLARVAAILNPMGNDIMVEGHTDNVPIRTASYPSNWELSAARAASVVHLFANRGIDPGRLSIHGFGAQRPVADNGTVEGRNANRRVTLLLLARQVEDVPVDLVADQGQDSDGPELASLPASE